jgi:hypothetical protein
MHRNTKEIIDCRQTAFLMILPRIQSQAWNAFQGLSFDLKQELQSEVVGHCWKSFIKLFELGRHEDVSPMSLASFAIRAVRSGRRMGASLNINDVSSNYCQRRLGIRTTPFCMIDQNGDKWAESLIADERARPDQLVMARIDFSEWLQTLKPLHRKVAEHLSLGESTHSTARIFNLTPGRISQIRRLLEQSWLSFQTEDCED